jgi:hypothetical protein
MAHCMFLGIDAYDVILGGWRQGQGQTSCGESWRQEPPFSRPARLFASKLEINSIPSTRALFWAVF